MWAPAAECCHEVGGRGTGTMLREGLKNIMERYIIQQLFWWVPT